MKLHYLVIRDYAGGLAQEKTMDIQGIGWLIVMVPFRLQVQTYNDSVRRCWRKVLWFQGVDKSIYSAIAGCTNPLRMERVRMPLVLCRGRNGGRRIHLCG